MSFKSFNCDVYGVPNPSDTAPWSEDGFLLVITSATATGSIIQCNEDLSYFPGAAPYVSTSLSQSDFYILWPLLAGLMVTGYISKRLRLAIAR